MPEQYITEAQQAIISLLEHKEAALRKYAEARDSEFYRNVADEILKAIRILKNAYSTQ